MRNTYFYLSAQSQIENLAAWSDSKDVLQALLTNGHTDVHYRGDTNIPGTMDEIRSVFYQNEEYSMVRADADTVAQQIKRSTAEMLPSSHFMNKSTAITALSEVIFACAKDINKWLNDEHSRGAKLKLTVNLDTFVGTGVGMDGNEYATTATTIVLMKMPTYLDNGGRVPFSVNTMYPDITGEREVGTLIATGRNFGEFMAHTINSSDDKVARMFWQLKDAGEPVLYDRMRNSVMRYGEMDGYQYKVCYNQNSVNSGLILVKDPSTGFYISATKTDFLTREQVNALRNEEYTYYPMLMKAMNRGTDVISKDSPLFAARQEEMLFEGSDRPFISTISTNAYNNHEGHVFEDGLSDR